MLKLSSFFISRRCFGFHPFSTKSIAKIIVCLGEVWLKFNSLAKLNNGIIYPPFL
jgi:hypothetical protein